MGQSMPFAKLPREVDLVFERGPELKDITDPWDLHRVLLAREQAVRDEAIRIEKLKIVREALAVCYRQHRVNHHYKCRPICLEYLKMIQDKTWTVYNFEEDEVDPNKPAAAQTKKPGTAA